MKYFIGACFIFLLASCKKENADFAPDPVTDYFPLQVGKYITYNLDSTLFTNFGQNKIVRHYEAQYKVDAQVTDNLGRPAFTINRFLRKDSTEPWQIDNVFTAIPTANSIELVQDNLRFIKLVAPVNEGYSWEGNSYLPYDPYRSYVFANPAFMEDWNYIYQNVNKPETVGTQNYDSTITVFEVSDSTGDPKTTEYAEKTSSIEKYAKGVGLIYKDFIHWEYQSGDNTYKGFGETLSIIDHN